MPPSEERLVIIGSGPAGWSASIYAAGFPAGDLGAFLDSALPKDRRMMMPPHEGHGVTGPELMELMRQQAANFGTRIVTDDIVKVDFSKRPFVLTGGAGDYTADAVIIATGASA